MKRPFSFLLLIVTLATSISCGEKEKTIENGDIITEENNKIIGTWLLVYGETRTGDSIEIKDLSKTKFIKILNKDHFAFFNQLEGTDEGFYGGGGSYALNGNSYVERLDYVGIKELRGEEFSFELEVKGDSLIQSGFEDVPEAGIKRHIVEKYIRIKE
ncbi:hypothetical protein [Flagellimonas aequoris]|uniref:Lipocalin-like domain-containing protein n=1 Tax=Flagellimonas aequoris TaxID=2306997 RepID=A0A418NBG3_9FLAO|nr:hypothetical protein [Allomuricauda aequoris]RIV73918.1 hypothetical protein D2U88_02460 [Allomuricauda aequoris]TXK07606.1 hypothetical protein FQ019_02440 [Allomuricauda aequoris]